MFAPIQDCDETFNYWEPTHYLSHGYGLQTWEYSPDFAIRSWLYIGLHAIVGNLRRLLPHSNKVCRYHGAEGLSPSDAVYRSPSSTLFAMPWLSAAPFARR